MGSKSIFATNVPKCCKLGIFGLEIIMGGIQRYLDTIVGVLLFHVGEIFIVVGARHDLPTSQKSMLCNTFLTFDFEKYYERAGELGVADLQSFTWRILQSMAKSTNCVQYVPPQPQSALVSHFHFAYIESYGCICKLR